jgi:hypothetical protein
MFLQARGFPEESWRQSLSGGSLFARSAIRRHTELGLEAPQILDTRPGGLANLLVGDRVADTDVHKFNKLRALTGFNCK